MFGVSFAQVDVALDASGNASVLSPFISGEILKVIYVKGTVDASTTVTVKTTAPIEETIDSYNVNSGSAARYPREAVEGAAAGDNKWTPFVVASKLRISVTGGAVSKAFTVYVYYR